MSGADRQHLLGHVIAPTLSASQYNEHELDEIIDPYEASDLSLQGFSEFRFLEEEDSGSYVTFGRKKTTKVTWGTTV